MLLSNKGLKRCVASVNVTPLDTTVAHEAFDELLKQVKGWNVIPANDEFWTKTAEALTNRRTYSDHRQKYVHQVLSADYLS